MAKNLCGYIEIDPKDGKAVIRNYDIPRGMWRNFSAQPNKKFGRRSFTIIFENNKFDDAKVLEEMGYKLRESTYNGDVQKILDIRIEYDSPIFQDPDVKLVENGVVTDLNKKTIGNLDEQMFSDSLIKINKSSTGKAFLNQGIFGVANSVMSYGLNEIIARQTKAQISIEEIEEEDSSLPF